MSEYGLTAENLLASFPVALGRDTRLYALASAAAEVLAARVEEIGSVSLYANIDRLPEELLDILANDYKVDWYDYNYSLEVKRALIKDCIRVHRKLGTPAAVNWVIQSVFGNGGIEEWFEYGGEPHHFRVFVSNDSTFTSMDAYEKFLRLLSSVKRLSSWLDGLTVETDLGTAAVHIGGRMAVVSRIPIPALE